MGLDVDKVPGDGNCLFTAIAKQLKTFLKDCTKKETKGYILNLDLGKSVEPDARKLRTLFVDELIRNIDVYGSTMPYEDCDILKEIEQFRNDGYFNSDVGDTCAIVIADLLRIPIVIVTAFPSHPTNVLLSKNMLTSDALYIAYNHAGPGHYDGTKGMDFVCDVIFSKTS